MLNIAEITKGDLEHNMDEAWNMRKVMWCIYDRAMKHFDDAPDVPGWKLKFVRSKAQAITFFREGQNKDMEAILKDLGDKEALFKGTIFEPYMYAMLAAAVASPEKFKKEGGGKLDGQQG